MASLSHRLRFEAKNGNCRLIPIEDDPIRTAQGIERYIRSVDAEVTFKADVFASELVYNLCAALSGPCVRKKHGEAGAFNRGYHSQSIFFVSQLLLWGVVVLMNVVYLCAYLASRFELAGFRAEEELRVMAFDVVSVDTLFFLRAATVAIKYAFFSEGTLRLWDEAKQTPARLLEKLVLVGWTMVPARLLYYEMDRAISRSNFNMEFHCVTLPSLLQRRRILLNMARVASLEAYIEGKGHELNKELQALLQAAIQETEGAKTAAELHGPALLDQPHDGDHQGQIDPLTRTARRLWDKEESTTAAVDRRRRSTELSTQRRPSSASLQSGLAHPAAPSRRSLGSAPGTPRNDAEASLNPLRRADLGAPAGPGEEAQSPAAGRLTAARRRSSNNSSSRLRRPSRAERREARRQSAAQEDLEARCATVEMDDDEGRDPSACLPPPHLAQAYRGFLDPDTKLPLLPTKLYAWYLTSAAFLPSKNAGRFTRVATILSWAYALIPCAVRLVAFGPLYTFGSNPLCIVANLLLAYVAQRLMEQVLKFLIAGSADFARRATMADMLADLLDPTPIETLRLHEGDYSTKFRRPVADIRWGTGAGSKGKARPGSLAVAAGKAADEGDNDDADDDDDIHLACAVCHHKENLTGWWYLRNICMDVGLMFQMRAQAYSSLFMVWAIGLVAATIYFLVRGGSQNSPGLLLMAISAGFAQLCVNGAILLMLLKGALANDTTRRQQELLGQVGAACDHLANAPPFTIMDDWPKCKERLQETSRMTERYSHALAHLVYQKPVRLLGVTASFELIATIATVAVSAGSAVITQVSTAIASGNSPAGPITPVNGTALVG